VEAEGHDDGMAKLWTSPRFPKGRVDWAGDILAGRIETDVEADLDSALEIINNWRSSHSYPLQALKMTLRMRARSVDRKSITVQRLKRLTSIAAKLERNPNMHFSQMQDIGGCRAIVQDMRKVSQLVGLYTKSYAKNPNVRAQFVKPFDYVSQPKIDGYRSIHLIYKYRSKPRRLKPWNGLRIEIQIRSKLQHAWATAVETVDAFTGKGLKVSGGTGTEKKDWGRFFALMSSAIACREKCPMVPNTPATEAELVPELRALTEQLQVVSTLAGWTYYMKSIGEEAEPDDVLFLLALDPEERTYSWKGFKRSQIKQAQREYLDVEKGFKLRPGNQAVLVAADSMEAVRAAYPNFYADTGEFARALREAIGEKNERKRKILQPNTQAVPSSAQRIGNEAVVGAPNEKAEET
jgi:hypothetical protein